MEKRRLGRTELQVTVMGLGGAPIGRENCTEEEALETVWATLEAGVNLIDTAPHYGLGLSETRIGLALRERPDLAADCILSTKTGHYGEIRDYSYDTTLRSVERSCKRLSVTSLPIVHIHGVWNAEELRTILGSRSAHAALRALQEEGVVGAIGIGTRHLDALQLAVDSGEFEVMMIANQYNLLNQAGRSVIESARERDVGILIAGAYATGILAKGPVPEARYDYRPTSQEVRDRTAALQELCGEWKCSLPAAAVQYCWRGPASTAVTVLGARTRQQAEANAAYAKEEISAGFWAELERDIKRSGFQPPPFDRSSTYRRPTY